MQSCLGATAASQRQSGRRLYMGCVRWDGKTAWLFSDRLENTGVESQFNQIGKLTFLRGGGNYWYFRNKIKEIFKKYRNASFKRYSSTVHQMYLGYS